MQLGLVAPGVVHTVRYFRGSSVVQNKAGHVVVEQNPNGGLCFFFEIDYNKNQLLFTASITMETDAFSKVLGRKICEERARADVHKTFKTQYDASEGLLDQVFVALANAEAEGELGTNPFLTTLLEKMRLYDNQNADAANFYQDMIDSGVIVVQE